jgi:putative SOS response-associated peptidase YedK
MCFHNSINTDTKKLEQKYKKKLKETKPLLLPIFHASGFEYPLWPVITPSDIEPMNWGLVPAWVKSQTEADQIKSKTLNARSESIYEKASFKNARACVIPSTGFFEWQTVGKEKIPYFISLKDTEMFSMAGIYDIWINTKGEPCLTYSILTTYANPLMEQIHNTKKRMPIILSENQETSWLNNELKIEDLFKPFDENLMKAHVISNTILTPNHNTVGVMAPQSKTITEQLSLF